MKTDILRLERNVLNFLRNYFAKTDRSKIDRKNQVRNPTVKEMAKHPKLLRKQRARRGGV